MSARDLTPAVTDQGRIIWLDEDGHREFSARTQQYLQVGGLVVLIVFLLIGLGIATGLVQPAPWSPIGQQVEQVEAPAVDLEDLVPPGYEPAVPTQPRQGPPPLNA